MWRQMTIRLFSVQFSRSVMSSSLQPHALQNARLSCPSPTPGAHSKLISIEWVMPSNHFILCHPLLLLPSIFPSTGFFLMSQFFCIRWPSIGASVSTSVLPVNIQHWFPLGLIGLIFLQSKGFARVFFNTTVQKYQFFFSAQLSSVLNFLYGPTLTSIRDYWKNHSFD